MAKICIFNTQVTEDSAGDPFVSAVPVSPAPHAYTKPVRLTRVHECTFEFIYSSSSRAEAEPAGAEGMDLVLYWWREFWGDDVPGSLKSPPPDARVLAAVYPDTPWSRETVDVEDPSGAISNLAATRQLVFSIPPGGYGAGLWITDRVHAPWGRLALYADAPGLSGGHLLINAHVGGHAEEKPLDAHGDLPYVYNF